MLRGFGKQRRVASSRMSCPVVKLRDYGAVADNRANCLAIGCQELSVSSALLGEKTGLLNVEVAGSLLEGWKLWREWNELCTTYGNERLRRMASQEAEMLEVDDGRTFCFTSVIAQNLR